MKTDNYIHVQGWMVSNLDLKGNELLAFAMIHGFSQDGKSEFEGSIKYVSDWLNCSRPTAIKTLENLRERNFIVKTSSDNETGKYKVNVTSAGNFIEGSKETLPVKKLYQSRNFTTGSKETLHNTNNTNTYISEEEFLDIWKRARLHYDRVPTHFKTLSFTEKQGLKDILKDYSKQDIEKAVAGLFFQDTIPNVRVRPTHLLDRQYFETYLDCWNNKKKIYSKDKKKKDNTGMI